MAMQEGEKRRQSGEVDQGRREKEAWFDGASAWQEKLMDANGDQAAERGRRLELRGEGDHVWQEIGILMCSGRLFLCVISLGRQGQWKKHRGQVRVDMEGERRVKGDPLG